MSESYLSQYVGDNELVFLHLFGGVGLEVSQQVVRRHERGAGTDRTRDRLWKNKYNT